jgi:hypothetical protein
VAYITAAGGPVKPPSPVLDSSDSEEVIIKLLPTSDDNGSPVTAYELYIDGMQATPSYKLVSSDLTLTRTITFAPPAGSTAAEITQW